LSLSSLQVPSPAVKVFMIQQELSLTLQIVLLKKVNPLPNSLPHSNSPQNWQGKNDNYNYIYFLN